MPVKKLKVLTAWSFSRWDKHAQCPLKARLSFIDKLKEPSSRRWSAARRSARPPSST